MITIVAYVDGKTSFWGRVFSKFFKVRFIRSDNYPDIYRHVDLARVERHQEAIFNNLFDSATFDRAIKSVGESTSLDNRSSQALFNSWLLRTTRTRLFRLLCIKELHPDEFVIGYLGLSGRLNLEILREINGGSIGRLPWPVWAWLCIRDFSMMTNSLLKILILTFGSIFLPIFSWLRNFCDPEEFQVIRARVAVAAFGIPLLNDSSKLSLFNFLSEISGHNENMRFLAIGAKGSDMPGDSQLVASVDLKFCSHPFSLADWVWLLRKQAGVVALLVVNGTSGGLSSFLVELAKCVFYGYKLKSLQTTSVVLTSSEVINPLLGSSARLVSVPVSFIYYSSNVSPLIFSEGGAGSSQNPYMKYLDADRHFIWDEGFKSLMTETYGYSAESLVVAGPIMFASSSFPRPKKLERRSEDALFCVGVFDVTPMSRSVWMRRYMGLQHYTAEKSENFFKDICEVISNLPWKNIRLVCKKKRPTPAGEDPMYESAIKNIFATTQLEVIEFAPDANPYNVIQQCDAVVSLPFTSITQAASYLGIPASYYWPGPSLENKVSPNTPVLYNRSQLLTWLDSIQHTKVRNDFSKVTRVISRNIPMFYSIS